MDYQSFIEQYSTAAIDEAKVAKVEEIYGVELPEEVKHYVSACGGKPEAPNITSVPLKLS